MVEFAIVAPLLFLLVFGIVDWGRFFFDYNNLTNAAREGARLGAVLPRGADAAASDATIIAAVVSRVGDARMEADMVTVTQVSASGVTTMRVEITGYPFTAASPIAVTRSTLPTVRAEFRHEFE